MPNVTFKPIRSGDTYSRTDLAALWGYKGNQGLSRGVVTPRGANYIILFVTHEKQNSYEQYENRLERDRLDWEGPKDHFAESRMMATNPGDEIHLFYRDKHHTDFTYRGKLRVENVAQHMDRPSRFIFRLLEETVEQ